jgi:phosphate starvation-inducible PhoH-like protein
MVDDMHTQRLEFDDCQVASQLFGPHNRNLERISRLSGADIDSRGNTLMLSAPEKDQVDAAARLLTELYDLIRSGRPMGREDIDQAWRVVSSDDRSSLKKELGEVSISVSGKKRIVPKTPMQRQYLEAVASSDLTFGIGPAGTGKTYLAVALAAQAIMRKEAKRLILTRPAVEAGEKLGFLPGDLVEKVNPYLRPLYDALHDMLDFQRVAEMLESGRIEVAPLAFMRGRTLNDAFVILDEAQNTTPEQMKMFLTRLGFNSKAVVTGDITQIDLPRHASSGLKHAMSVLEGVEGISFINFDDRDVIRHPLVGRIVQAYDRHQERLERQEEADQQG